MARVDLATCIRCAACAAVAPGVFEVTKKGTRVVRAPADEAEQTLVRVAALVCPVRAIRA